MAEIKLSFPLQYIKGVGPRKAEAMAAVGLKTVRDLLFHFPRTYLDRTSVTKINSLRIGEPATVIGRVMAHGLLYGRRRRYEVILQDDTAAITLVWFGALNYFKRTFQKGQQWAATGTVGSYDGYQMVHPELERLEEESDQMVHAGRIIPVYSQTAELSKAGLSSRGLRSLTSFVFDNLREKLDDPLPDSERKLHNLPKLHIAIEQIHYPESRESVESARRRHAFDELLALQYFVYCNRGKKDATIKPHRYAAPSDKLKSFRKLLPFELTNDQKQVIRELFDDMKKPRPMSRLLHGEVGCGKTVVAIAASVYAVENRLQVAFMAPTEILAAQHHRNWGKSLDEIGVSSALLTASLKAAQKKEIAAQCARGELDILFGTHALIYDYISFSRLGLVIIDEQHRFGVEQRGKLYAKGEDPDLLVMTATPIPRTLALTVYGDLDISTIKTLPPGRKPIRTVWRSEARSSQVYKYVRDEVRTGGQAYFIYPLVEKSDRIELLNVEDAYESLTKGVFDSLRVGLVHGRIKPAARDKVLQEFRERKLDVLLATIVIEVGIDNPDATLLVIEHAERFGLAQLHQLRGRVGRGNKAATVVAIGHSPVSEMARKRLDYFVQHADGFDIAEADLELRGPGELFGVRQSGAPELQVARFFSDRDLLEAARKLAARLFTGGNKLDSAYQQLYSSLERAAKQRQAFLGGG